MGPRVGLVITYLDSSGLLRLCFAEGDVSLVQAALSTTAVTSRLALVEIPNAIWARFHRRALTVGERDALLALSDEIMQGVSILELSSEMLAEAVRIGFRFPARALDAIHLATAATAARQQTRKGNELRFCTADIRQSDTAAALFGPKHVDLIPPL